MKDQDRPVSKENFIHVPVMLPEVLEAASANFADRPPRLLVDGTLGEAGHSLALHGRYPGAALLACDRDPQMLARARSRMEQNGIKPRLLETPGGSPGGDPGGDPVAAGSKPEPGEVVLHRGRFSGMAAVLEALDARPDLILLDLGVSMFHFQGAERGFSYGDELLDMRLDPELRRTAADLVNRLPEKELSHIFATYGEERFAGRIARAIIRGRPYSSARQLSELIVRVMPAGPRVGGKNGSGGRGGPARRIHPATRVFQALRIAVNQEEEELEAALRDLPERLAPGGILCVISFHSGEDRQVKQAFRQIGERASKSRRRQQRRRPAGGARQGFQIVTDKPLRPADDEVASNPAARSARLRVLRKKADNEMDPAERDVARE